MASLFTHVLVLDFDGTVCLGDAPVLAYARLLDEALAATGRSRTLSDRTPSPVPPAAEPAGEAAVEATVGRFLGAAADPDDSSAELRAALEIIANSVDGYEAAERLARSRGITDTQLAAAYAGSREQLASGSLETTAPAGLADLLESLPDSTQIVLVTNAPETGVLQQLRHLGLAESFDEVVTSAGKPAGMGPIARGLLERSGLAEHPNRLLSVGDIWRNDLAPVAALGCETALVERLPAPDARPTYRAATIQELYAHIEHWARTD